MLQAPEVFVEVIVPLAVPRAYTYVVPEQLSEYVDIGSRVVVPFGRQKVVTGVISGFTGNVDEDQMFKPLIDVLDDIPHLNEYQLKLFHWDVGILYVHYW
jgi:primosomal protein N' (replication factor Y)